MLLDTGGEDRTCCRAAAASSSYCAVGDMREVGISRGTKSSASQPRLSLRRLQKQRKARVMNHTSLPNYFGGETQKDSRDTGPLS